MEMPYLKKREGRKKVNKLTNSKYRSQQLGRYTERR
jgi:hypothetical protein